MGSSGGGSFSDYSNQEATPSGAGNGGTSNVDKCAIGIATSLEDVARCQYYMLLGLPAVGTDVTVVFHTPRLAVVDNVNGYEIGYLPTKYNYLKNCMDDGYSYVGSVRHSSVTPFPSVLVDIVPSI